LGREHQSIHLWTTTDRLIWDAGSCLASLWYGQITGFYPQLDNWTLTLAANDGQPPVRIQGPAVPLLSLWTATAVLRQRWYLDPRLADLLR
jgi:hypothetical protein